MSLLLIWADEKYNTHKISAFFLRPKKIPWTPLSVKYVSGAPGGSFKLVYRITKMKNKFSKPIVKEIMEIKFYQENSAILHNYGIFGAKGTSKTLLSSSSHKTLEN